LSWQSSSAPASLPILTLPDPSDEPSEGNTLEVNGDAVHKFLCLLPQYFLQMKSSQVPI